MLNLEDFSDLTVEEIEKMTKNINEEVKELEVRFKKKTNFKNPIDKFTDVDELLRQNINQQYITNKLLFAIYYKQGISGSIDRDIKPYQSNDIIERMKVSGDDYKTLVNNIANMKISGSNKVFEIEGSGILAECKIQSSNATVNNKAYGVSIVSDNSVVYKDTWANFENRSHYETDMSCWEDAILGHYILAFKNMAFAKSLTIEIYGSTVSVFSNIYLKYHLKV